MPRANLFFKTLRDIRWQVFWYGIGFAAIAAMIVYVYPSYKDQLADFEIPEALRAFLGEGADYASPAGFLSAEFFSWVPILVVIFAVMQGTNLVGGEESNGTMDILLAQPVSRKRLLIEKLAGFAAASAGIALLSCAGWLISVPFVSMDISYGSLFVATFNMVPLTLAFGSFALLASVALPTRQQATGAVTAIAVATFVANYLALLVEVLAPLRWASPFFYANTTNAITVGMDWPKLGVLVVATLVSAAVALVYFERRDIGIRPSGEPRTFWSRPRAAAA